MNENEIYIFEFHANLIVNGKLVPCLTALQEEHPGRRCDPKTWLTTICQAIGMGAAGAGRILGGRTHRRHPRGDWKRSLDILLPRVEGALRHVNNKAGIR